MTSKILQIVPTPPNQTDGIGDYSLQLAEQLLKEYQINTHFLVFRTASIEPVINGFPAISLPERNTQALLSVLPEDINGIVLHFSGYPYFNTNLRGMLGAGTPFWLVEALQSAISTRGLKLVVMFHELPRLYWKQIYFFDFLNPIHSVVSRRIARIANATITNSPENQTILSKWLKRPVTRISNFANIGEPDGIPPLAERKRRMIVFGGSARYRVYRNALKELIQGCQSLGIEEIYDIGPSLNLKERYHFPGINFVEMGFKPKEEISQLMLTSIAGCLDYNPFPGALGKSGVFAAYCSHGLVPISTQYNPSETDGLEMNKHYLVFSNGLNNLKLNELQTVADNAQHWYQTHNLKEVTKVFASQILDKI